MLAGCSTYPEAMNTSRLLLQRASGKSRTIARSTSSALSRRASTMIATSRFRLEVRGRGADGPRGTTLDELVEHHFSTWSEPQHLNRRSMHDALRRLDERPAVILETGSSAWGTNSSQLFDAYVSTFGGEFATVDLRIEPLLKLRSILSPRSTLACADSVDFLGQWVQRHPGRKADLVYLDSFDLDAQDPIPSAAHGLREFFAVRPALRDGALLLIDDTPSTLELYADVQRPDAEHFYTRHGLLPGKAMLLDRYLAGQTGVTKLHHDYQVLYRFD